MANYFGGNEDEILAGAILNEKYQQAVALLVEVAAGWNEDALETRHETWREK